MRIMLTDEIKVNNSSLSSLCVKMLQSWISIASCLIFHDYEQGVRIN